MESPTTACPPRKAPSMLKILWVVAVGFVFAQVALALHFNPLLSSVDVSSPKGVSAGPIDHRPDGEILYIPAQTDRSGYVISSMLKAHSCAFHKGVVFGGACQLELMRNYSNQVQHEMQQLRSQQYALLRAVGLDRVLPFACPWSNSTDGTRNEEKRRMIERMQEHFKLVCNGIADSWTQEWLQHIRSFVKYPPVPQESRTKAKKNVAVHVRRGDVTPCKHPERYSPNSYYMAVLDRYLLSEEDYEIVIYSESQSFESFDVFRRRNYTLRLDSDVASIWKAFLSADVVVTGRSDFSLAPSLLNRDGHVIYTPFYHQTPLPDWTVVSKGLQRIHDAGMKNLTANCSMRDIGRTAFSLTFWSTSAQHR